MKKASKKRYVQQSFANPGGLDTGLTKSEKLVRDLVNEAVPLESEAIMGENTLSTLTEQSKT